MITGELKNKIDSLWEMFWTGRITNPLDVVEQMTYLMFIHDLDETDAKKAKSSMMLELPYTSMFEGHEQYKWSVFRDLPAEKMFDLMQMEIFPFIKNLHEDKNSAYAKYMDDAIFKIPTPIFIYTGQFCRFSIRQLTTDDRRPSTDGGLTSNV